MNIGIIILKDGVIIYKNDYVENILKSCGGKKDINEVVNFVVSHCPEDIQDIKREVVYVISLATICKNDIKLEITISPLDIDKEINCILLTMKSIGEIDQTPVSLEDRAELFTALTKSTKIGILVHQENKWVYANPAVEEITGYPLEEFYKLKFWDIVHPDHREMVKQRGLRRQKGEEIPPYSFKIIRKDGNIRWVYLSGGYTTLLGRPAGIISIVDITNKMALEEELKKSESKYREILENMEEGYFETDLKGKLVFWNRALLKIFEANELGHLQSIHYKSFTPPESAQKLFKVFHKVYLTGQSIQMEDFDIYTQKGNLKNIEMSVRLIRDEQGNPRGFSGIVRDVTEKKRLYKEIEKNREYYRTIFELGPSAAAIIDKDFNIIDVNKTFEELFKINRDLLISKRNLQDFIDEHYAKVLKNSVLTLPHIKQHSLPPFEIKAKNEMNETLDLLCNVANVQSKEFYVISFMNLGPIKEIQKLNLQLEEQLKRAQRLEGIGLMASGIAHDFNNILQGISGNLFLLGKEVLSERGKRAYANLENLVQRGAKIVKELLTYGKTKEEKFSSIDINNVIKDVSGLFSSILPKNINLELHLKEDIKNILGDYTGIQQMIMNLIQNAMDAMESKNSGTIYIKSTMEYIYENNDMFTGEYVVVEIEDTGCGMDADTKSKIFDPFFTTKGPIKGTGLGMSIVKKVIDNHNGYIFCDSEVGKGTTFKIYFPTVSTGEKKDSSNKDKLNKKEKDISTEIIKVFLVEDEEMILEMTTTFLQEIGFNVISASSGTLAIEMYENEHKGIDVVVLDINLPGLSGTEVLKRIFQIDPKQKVIISSGYSKDSIAELKDLHKENIKLIQKPYSLEKLKDAILELLKPS